MHPVLLKLSTRFGDLPLYAYSVFVVVAFLACLTYGLLEFRRQGESTDRAIDLSLWNLIFSILGSRALHDIVEWRQFADRPLDILKIWQGGLAYYGGFFAATIACLVFIRYHQLPLAKWADLLAPVGLITVGFGRIGCLLNGCCYGKPAPGLSWAITYPAGHLPLALDGIPLHPTPAYESLAAFLLTGYLIFLLHRPHRPGQVVWTMILGYAVIRFILEYFRADPRGGLTVFGLALSTSQVIALPLAALSLLALSWTFLTQGNKI